MSPPSTKARRDELAEQIGMLTSKDKETAKHYFKFGWDSAQSLANEREKVLVEALRFIKSCRPEVFIKEKDYFSIVSQLSHVAKNALDSIKQK